MVEREAVLIAIILVAVLTVEREVRTFSARGTTLVQGILLFFA